ncbi:deoxyribonuclease IV [Candidatus Methylacidiphilum infernorum]|uniref:Probable endonuclease 4 n=1 Tax=Candidatus Methylacidiphilum infernorum TaxID=511746 RepID=A0ABX7PV85_9BACT|nr:deoxyribonuclease IV [Candidatus Methylacidiphilum infernorum]QSR86910.1 deoxyribonuclease IV [Candidatus Methylacidiphilum infernorum]
MERASWLPRYGNQKSFEMRSLHNNQINEVCTQPLLPGELKSTLLGAHVSIAGGFSSAARRACACGFKAAQIFLKNCRRWEEPKIDEKDIEAFVSLKEQNNIFFFGHFSYLINLCSRSKEITQKSLNALVQEIIVAEKLTLPFVVLHPGTIAVGKSEISQAIEVLCGYLNQAVELTKNTAVKIALETMAGQRGQLGWKLEQLREIIERVDSPERFCFCLDTAHLWEAGYELKTAEGYQKTMEKIALELGLPRIAAIHLNDSFSPYGSKVDRHAHIGEGTLGVEPFRRLVNDSRFLGIPMVLETPKEKGLDDDCRNLRKILSH